FPKTGFECPLIGNGDSVIIIIKRFGQMILFIQSGWNRDEYRPLTYSEDCLSRDFFSVIGKCSYYIKTLRCGVRENLQSRLFII
ncbi:MAG: hypothetical protein RR366_06065, partial [Clostridium sp.]